jgi:hypothetical protein
MNRRTSFVFDSLHHSLLNRCKVGDLLEVQLSDLRSSQFVEIVASHFDNDG